MTVHVHRIINEIVTPGCHHRQPSGVAEDDRTWSFECNDVCEARTLRDVEFTGTNAANVPLTPDEKDAEERFTAQSRVDVSNLAAALGQLGKERAALVGS